MKKIFSILLLCIICFSLKAQRLEWANVITGDVCNSTSRGLTIDTDNNSYLLGTIQNTTLNTNLDNLSTIVKYNKDGALLWAKNFSFYISNIIAEKTTCDIYAVVYIDKTEIIGTDTFQQSTLGLNSKYILLKADSSFNIKWAKEIGKLAGTSLYDDIPIKITKDRLFVAIDFNGGFTTPKGYYNSPVSKSTYLLLNFDKTESGSSSEWETPVATITSNIILQNVGLIEYERIDLDNEGNTYFIGSSKNIADTLIINNIPYNVKGSYIIVLNKDGALEKLIHIEDLMKGTISILPSKKIFISGYFYSKFNYKGISLNTNSLQPTPSSAILMLLNNDGTPIWVKKEENDFKKGLISFFLTEYHNNNIYVGGLVFDGETSLGGFKVGRKSDISYSDLLFGKIDTLGNILWIQGGSIDTAFPRSSSAISALKVDYEGYPIFTGNFADFVALLDTALFGSGGSNTTLFKLNNYSIERGYVYGGPYCAGDTIDIPYTIRGVFEPDNEFIAQLSDENGEFIGGERELGREKSTTDGVVKGTLPLFNVNTSGNYRIRILSTHPPVQSFYKKDTLRLLIYSRDSANTGNDTIVCRGQSVQLSTTGGSKWDWSPAESLDDSTLFKPTATPKTDTRYRIIISDSSGCGDTDTDYVWVRLRQPLKLDAPFTDSTICRGQTTKLFATGFGGDSTNYSISWYERDANGDVLLSQNIDSISISNSSSTKTFFAVLTDNCTTKPDTQLYTINILAPLKTSIVGNRNDTLHLADTLICYDTDLKLYAYSTGGRVSTSTISWYDTGFIAMEDSVLLPKAQPQKYYTILSDNCTVLSDTAIIEVKQRQPLSITINAKDSVCSRNPIQLSSVLSGGDSTKYQVNWITNNTGWASNQNPTQHTPNAITTYIATLSDNCSPNAIDSFAVKVLPLPTPQFIFNNTYGCPPLQVEYQDKSNGNTRSENRWVIDNGTEITNSNTSKLFSKTAITTAKLVATNQFGCTDSITKSERINVFRKPQAQFVVTPARLEVEEPITFTSTSSEAIKYQWDLSDGFLRYDEGIVKKVFNNEGNQTITLVAENSLGCKDTAYKTIRVFEKVYCAIPNAFTPNGDGLNNTFSPQCEGINNYTLTIYSRWGQVIHQSRNGAWDGTYADKPVPEGVYMYKIHIHAQSKNKSMLYGSVNVIR